MLPPVLLVLVVLWRLLVLLVLLLLLLLLQLVRADGRAGGVHRYYVLLGGVRCRF